MINIFSAKGRIGRVIYFFWMLTIAFLAAVAHIIVDENVYWREFWDYMIPVYVITWLLTVIPMVRRLHDMDKSGSLCLWSLIPLVNLGLGLYLLFGKGNVGTNKYGPPPRKLVMPAPSHNDAFYQQAYEELESGQINKGLWAKALVESDGNESKARAKYIKKRCAKMIMDEEEKRSAEVMAMDIIENEKRESAEKSAAILYKQAYVLHYRKRDKEQAKIVYDEILHNHPNSPEASSAKYQLDRLKL